MTTKFGAFGEPSYISTDADVTKSDPYIKAEPIPSRYLGASFSVGRMKKGKGPDALLEKKFKTLASAEQNNGKEDPYVDPNSVGRKATMEAKKKNISERDFRYTSPGKKSTGSGSYTGCIQSAPIPHEPDYKATQRGEVPERPKPQPTNIKTAPAKKGTYGMIGTTLGKIEPSDKSKPDEYEAMRIMERKRWEESKKKIIHQQPFKTLGRPKRFFDEKNATGVSDVFHQEPIKEPKEPKGEKKKEEKKDLKPFVCSSPPKSGQQGCLNKYPNSHTDQPEPYDSLRIQQKKDKEKAPKLLGGTWKPVASGCKQGATRSLLKRYY
jgi:hypothetical protein